MTEVFCLAGDIIAGIIFNYYKSFIHKCNTEKYTVSCDVLNIAVFSPRTQDVEKFLRGFSNKKMHVSQLSFTLT